MTRVSAFRSKLAGSCERREGLKVIVMFLVNPFRSKLIPMEVSDGQLADTSSEQLMQDEDFRKYPRLHVKH